MFFKPLLEGITDSNCRTSLLYSNRSKMETFLLLLVELIQLDSYTGLYEDWLVCWLWKKTTALQDYPFFSVLSHLVEPCSIYHLFLLFSWINSAPLLYWASYLCFPKTTHKGSEYRWIKNKVESLQHQLLWIFSEDQL